MNASFAERLLLWFDLHGRRDLPWQHPREPYRVWLSEIMLQQTQVATVIGYFERFVRELPNLRALAAASSDQVLALWAGLGYYSRARNLHRAAHLCVTRHAGDLPRDIEGLSALPGIGRSTAAAILAQAHGQRHAILDGNVKRVLARHAGIYGDVARSDTLRALWNEAETRLPQARLADYTQAIMDLGATVCTRTRPRCDACPVSSDCIARRDDATAALPQRRVAREIPQRSTVMLLLHDDMHRVLLERRPPVGIWGGLWSLPQVDELPDAERAATDRYGVRMQSAQAQPSMIHTFTHFRLTITPLQARVSHDVQISDRPHIRWASAETLTDHGVPKPVRDLLLQFWEKHT